MRVLRQRYSLPGPTIKLSVFSAVPFGRRARCALASRFGCADAALTAATRHRFLELLQLMTEWHARSRQAGPPNEIMAYATEPQHSYVLVRPSQPSCSSLPAVALARP